ALSSEFDWQHHIYRMSVIPLGMPPEVLLVLHDITEVKTMDRRKNDFLARVSHELRTPLTAIKGYAETLTVEGEKNQRFLEIIKKHTERIIALVNDLMLLSQLEETGPRLVREKVDCLTLVKEVVTLFEREIERKKLRFSPEVTPKTFVSGDRFYLQQMLINLVDNAIKYTEAGEIKVLVFPEGKNICFVVKDTGIGINQENLNQIFEKFYMVNPSFSRKIGGTGLGLAIVKEIVEHHRGTIEVRSSPGLGSEFIISLPASA
ncbi:MAG TPA: ATP-binding protein, partial [bacterium]|nr:ATP-binding protein [bacterium]